MLNTTGMGLVKILIDLVIACIVIYGVYIFLNFLNLPQPIKTLILLVIAIIGLVFLANLFGVAF